jgi:hypothetical protein
LLPSLPLAKSDDTCPHAWQGRAENRERVSMLAQLLAMVPEKVPVVAYGRKGDPAAGVQPGRSRLQFPFAVYPLVRLTNSKAWWVGRRQQTP